MTTCVYIISFPRDYQLLAWSVASLQKYLRGECGIKVMVPEGPAPALPIGPHPVSVQHFQETPGRGFLFQMLLKCQADLYCPGFDRILHWDSDCMLCRPTDLAEFGVAKPIVYYGSYASLFPAAPHLQLWQAAVKHCLGFTPEHEFMRCFPMQYPAYVYPSTRRRVETITGRRFDDYVLSTRNEFPQTFAEFNTIGAWAFLEHRRGVDFRDWSHGPSWGWHTIQQFWGPGGPDFRQPHQDKTPRQCAQYLGII
jgi:hypothetical protein